ncbi:LGFP repeat-containing protein [Nonomuraea sp. NPDC050663]|uniref:LGFP repeat-containing protein n=1 Tax=Nonomuraea sp. NPDC050663 TaxID=3364370 RepID=UPI0037A03D24
MPLSARALLGLATALGTAATAIAISALPASASVCDPSLEAPAGSLVGDLWRSNGGERSVYGCPTTKEYGYAGQQGSYQQFRNGKIVWSPNLGGGTLVRAYYANGKAVFRWSGLGRDWDFFNVRWSVNGGKATQVKVGRLTPWSGAYSVDPTCQDGVCMTSNGHGGLVRAAFIVQGCDRGTFSSDCGPWSIVTSVKVPY